MALNPGMSSLSVAPGRPGSSYSQGRRRQPPVGVFAIFTVGLEESDADGPRAGHTRNSRPHPGGYGDPAARSGMKGRVEDGGPLGEEAGAAGGVVGEKGGQAQAADEIEGRLDDFAGSRTGLVDAEGFEGQAVGLPAETCFQGEYLLAERGVGAGGHPELQGGSEERAGEEIGEHQQDVEGAG